MERWRSNSGAWGSSSPAATGFTQQLTFGPDGQLTVRRNGAVLRHTTYTLSVESFTRCGQQLTQVPLLSFDNEKEMPNDQAKTYTIQQQNGQSTLILVGKTACVDYGAVETYHWVAE